MPVDPAEIASALGIQVLQAELPQEVVGVLMKRVGYDSSIVVAAMDSDNRRLLLVDVRFGRQE